MLNKWFCGSILHILFIKEIENLFYMDRISTLLVIDKHWRDAGNTAVKPRQYRIREV